ncbi:hypothetical protein RHGRI_037616 [Rhododendron griersonianum]|uniref:Uncharacterized protein n=1 Tax=Rhododendron griersonianum TaxID=479676 RepID=A0AAV6HSG1_9ERIC|nr:hypothetical protein RHGRI_037616 [Rhododendron griersonianum]
MAGSWERVLSCECFIGTIGDGSCNMSLTSFVCSGLDNQGLKGFLPNDISKLRHLQNINLSENSIHGPIPSSVGTITSLVIL